MAIGMNAVWRKREIAEALIHAAGDLAESWDDADIDVIEVRECLTRWLQNLPGTPWDDRLGPRPEKRTR